MVREKFDVCRGVQDAASMRRREATETRDLYPPHVCLGELKHGIKSGKYVQGKFHLSRDNCLEASVNVHDSDQEVSTASSSHNNSNSNDNIISYLSHSKLDKTSHF